MSSNITGKLQLVAAIPCLIDLSNYLTDLVKLIDNTSCPGRIGPNVHGARRAKLVEERTAALNSLRESALASQSALKFPCSTESGISNEVYTIGIVIQRLAGVFQHLIANETISAPGVLKQVRDRVLEFINGLSILQARATALLECNSPEDYEAVDWDSLDANIGLYQRYFATLKVRASVPRIIELVQDVIDLIDETNLPTLGEPDPERATKLDSIAQRTHKLAKYANWVCEHMTGSDTAYELFNVVYHLKDALFQSRQLFVSLKTNEDVSARDVVQSARGELVEVIASVKRYLKQTDQLFPVVVNLNKLMTDTSMRIHKRDFATMRAESGIWKVRACLSDLMQLISVINLPGLTTINGDRAKKLKALGDKAGDVAAVTETVLNSTNDDTPLWKTLYQTERATRQLAGVFLHIQSNQHISAATLVATTHAKLEEMIRALDIWIEHGKTFINCKTNAEYEAVSWKSLTVAMESYVCDFAMIKLLASIPRLGLTVQDVIDRVVIEGKLDVSEDERATKIEAIKTTALNAQKIAEWVSRQTSDAPYQMWQEVYDVSNALYQFICLVDGLTTAPASSVDQVRNGAVQQLKALINSFDVLRAKIAELVAKSNLPS